MTILLHWVKSFGMLTMRKVLVITLLTLVLLTGLFLALAPGILENSMNRVRPHAAYVIPKEAQALHDSLVVADLHADSTLWYRDLARRSDRGHVDLPRLREGNVAIQVFTVVTKTPAGQNYEQNAAAARDNITALALVQRWPVATWDSLSERALYQARRLQALEQQLPEQFFLLRNAEDVRTLLQRRIDGEPVIAGVLGTEGSHALAGELDNVQTLFDAGYRVMGLQHFFDNELGGSLHGQSGAGLTAFGREALARMRELGIIVDLAHSSEAVVVDVMAAGPGPLIVSHTGFKGHCDTPRNISDDLMWGIAQMGGLIGVGYWDAAVCDPSPAGIVRAIRYGIDLVGVEHVALGSDFDGAVEAPFDTSELAVLTAEMLRQGFTEEEIRRVMGGNVARFLHRYLPGGAGD